MIKFSRSNEKYGCFSNFYPCSVEYGGIVYPNSECAWQSLKTLDMEKRKKFATYKAADAKKMGRRVELRSDWEEVKYQLMRLPGTHQAGSGPLRRYPPHHSL